VVTAGSKTGENSSTDLCYKRAGILQLLLLFFNPLTATSISFKK